MDKIIRVSKLLSNDWDNSETASSNEFCDLPSEFRIRNQIKYSGTSNAVQAIFREYCNNSSVHGVKYWGEEKRPIWEKFMWIFIFSFSFTISIIKINNIYAKWQTNPVIVTFSEKLTPIGNIPFPAITLCLETNAELNVFNFTNVYKKLWANRYKNGTLNLDGVDDEEFDNFKAMLQICSVDHMKELKFPNGTFSDFLNVPDFIKRIENIEPNPNISLAFCKFDHLIGMCEKLNLTKVYSDEGICYKFNGLKNRDLYRETTFQYENDLETDKVDLWWNIEDGYSINDTETSVNENYPKRVLGTGENKGLLAALQGFDYNFDYFCRDHIQGFKVILHSPDDAAQISKHFVRIPFGKEVVISVIPNIILTNKKLISFSPMARQCYFRNERQLTFFKIYSQTNCQLECLTNYTLMKCNCVKFSMPRFMDTPVCNVNKLECVDEAENEYLFDEFKENLKTTKENYSGETKCNCLPGCTSLSYETEIYENTYDFKRLLEVMQDEHLDEFPGLLMARLGIFFKYNQYQTSKRSVIEIFGLVDFTAGCGGLLALFIGVSAISVAELIYFCIVRLISNLYMRKHSQQLLENMAKQNTEISNSITI